MLMFADRFSKYVMFVPTTQALDAKGFAKLLIYYAVAFNELLDDLVSDRGPPVASVFWKEVCNTGGKAIFMGISE